MKNVIGVYITLLLATSQVCFAQIRQIKVNPAKTFQEMQYFTASDACNPAVVGKNVSQHFLPDKRYIKEKNLRNFIAYPEVCAWLGALRFAEAAKDKSLLNDLVRRFDPLFTTDKSYLPGKDHEIGTCP